MSQSRSTTTKILDCMADCCFSVAEICCDAIKTGVETAIDAEIAKTEGETAHLLGDHYKAEQKFHLAADKYHQLGLHKKESLLREKEHQEVAEQSATCTIS